jgi:hypothetical protein
MFHVSSGRAAGVPATQLGHLPRPLRMDYSSGHNVPWARTHETCYSRFATQQLNQPNLKN